MRPSQDPPTAGTRAESDREFLQPIELAGNSKGVFPALMGRRAVAT